MMNNVASTKIHYCLYASFVSISKNFQYNFGFQINYIEKGIQLGDVIVFLAIDEEATSTNSSNSSVLLRDGWVTWQITLLWL